MWSIADLKTSAIWNWISAIDQRLVDFEFHGGGDPPSEFLDAVPRALHVHCHIAVGFVFHEPGNFEAACLLDRIDAKPYPLNVATISKDFSFQRHQWIAPMVDLIASPEDMFSELPPVDILRPFRASYQACPHADAPAKLSCNCSTKPI